MPAIKYQKLGIDSDSAWDAGANIKRLKSGEPNSYYEKMYTWETEDADGNKSDFKFPHHEVSEGGEIGEANMKGVAGCVAALNGARTKTTIPDADKKDVYEHLKEHYEEAGITGDDIPELKCDGVDPEDIDPDGDDPDGDDPEVDSRFKKGKIEYRAAKVRATVIDTRSTEEGGQSLVKVLEGRPIVFDTPTPTFEDWDGNQWFEQIHHDALDGVDLSNVILKYNHSMHVPPFASTKAGTLDLKVDSGGMGMSARMANTSQANDMHELVKTGELDKMSFAFVVASDDYNYKTKTRTIFQFDKIYDVSIVDFPAYEQTSVTARKQFNAKMEARRKEVQKEKEKKSQQKQAEEAKQRETEEARQREAEELKKQEQRKKLILKTML